MLAPAARRAGTFGPKTPAQRRTFWLSATVCFVLDMQTLSNTPALAAYEALAPTYDVFTAEHDHDRWLRRLDGARRGAWDRRLSTARRGLRDGQERPADAPARLCGDRLRHLSGDGRDRPRAPRSDSRRLRRRHARPARRPGHVRPHHLPGRCGQLPHDPRRPPGRVRVRGAGPRPDGLYLFDVNTMLASRDVVRQRLRRGVARRGVLLAGGTGVGRRAGQRLQRHARHVRARGRRALVTNDEPP